MKTSLMFIIENEDGDKRFCNGHGTSQEEFNTSVERFTDVLLDLFKSDQKSLDKMVIELLVCIDDSKFYKTYASLPASEWISEWQAFLFKDDDNQKRYSARVKRVYGNRVKRVADKSDLPQVDLRPKKGWFK